MVFAKCPFCAVLKRFNDENIAKVEASVKRKWQEQAPTSEGGRQSGRVAANGGKKEEDWIYGMAVAKIGVGGAVDEREEERNESERNCRRVAAENEKDDAQKRGERDERTEEEDGAHERRVRRKKIVPRGFCAEPCSGDAAGDEAGFKSAMRADELPSEAALFVYEGGFPELGVEARFAKACDALRTADGVFVENVIVAEPELERKIRAERD